MGSAIISFIVIGVIILIIKIAFAAPQIARASRIVQNVQSLTQSIEKAQYLAKLFRSNIDSSKLDFSNKKYFNYYLSYLDACVKSVSEYDGATYDDAVRTTIYIEAYKLKENPPVSHEFSTENLQEGEALLKAALQTEYGIKGAQDGKADGDYSNNPSNPPPYFQRLMSYFGT